MGTDARVLGRCRARRPAHHPLRRLHAVGVVPRTAVPLVRRHRVHLARRGGRGTLFSYAVVRYAWIPQVADRLPFVTALVALDEAPGVRLPTYIVDCAAEDLRCDQPVHVVFRPLRYAGIERTVIAPLFTPVT
jgi:uncharacterized OB-fold protein